MKSFAPFIGSKSTLYFISLILTLLVSFSARAQYVPEVMDAEPQGARPTPKKSYLIPTAVGIGTVAAFYEISRLQQGPLVFAALDSMVAVYLLREVYTDKNEFDKLTIPLSLVTLAIVNAALLQNGDRFSSHEVFLYNTIGTGLIAAYAYWDYHSDPKYHDRYSHIIPFINESHTGFAWTLRY